MSLTQDSYIGATWRLGGKGKRGNCHSCNVQILDAGVEDLVELDLLGLGIRAHPSLPVAVGRLGARIEVVIITDGRKFTKKLARVVIVTVARADVLLSVLTVETVAAVLLLV